MSLFTILASIASQLEKIMTDFLCDTNENGNGLHWVNWDEVRHPQQEGGLGIRPRIMNDTLKTKWLWRFAKEEDAMRTNVIKVKYRIDDYGSQTKKSFYSHKVSCWKSILVVFEHFKSLVYFEVKEGSRVLFWHDVWCGDCPLKTQFSNLFRITHFKNATIQVVARNGDIWR